MIEFLVRFSPVLAAIVWLLVLGVLFLIEKWDDHSFTVREYLSILWTDRREPIVVTVLTLAAAQYLLAIGYANWPMLFITLGLTLFAIWANAYDLFGRSISTFGGTSRKSIAPVIALHVYWLSGYLFGFDLLLHDEIGVVGKWFWIIIGIVVGVVIAIIVVIFLLWLFLGSFLPWLGKFFARAYIQELKGKIRDGQKERKWIRMELAGTEKALLKYKISQYDFSDITDLKERFRRIFGFKHENCSGKEFELLIKLAVLDGEFFHKLDDLFIDLVRKVEENLPIEPMDAGARRHLKILQNFLKQKCWLNNKALASFNERQEIINSIKLQKVV